MKKVVFILLAILFAFVIAGLAYYKLSILPSLRRFNAIKATQFYSLSIGQWAMDYERGNKKLPYPYPHSFEDLSTYGYLENDFIDHLNASLVVTFHSPPRDIPPDFVIIEAAAPSSTWVVRLLDGSANGSGHYMPPIHEELKQKAQQDAAANP
jgi:hypothetical protein